jgi:hypothetical protein
MIPLTGPVIEQPTTLGEGWWACAIAKEPMIDRRRLDVETTSGSGYDDPVATRPAGGNPGGPQFLKRIRHQSALTFRGQ